MTDRRRNGLILLLVLGLVIASGAAIVLKKTRLGLDLKGGVELVYQGKPTPQQPKVDAAAMDRAVDIIRERVDSLGVGEPEIQRFGATQLSVGLPDVKNADRAQRQVGTTAQLYFYDWEPNVIGPSGNPEPTDASVTDQPLLNLFLAVQRAAKRKPETNLGSSIGAQWYVFSKDNQLIAGPEDTEQDLYSELPGQAKPAGSKVFKVNEGTTIVQAERPDGLPKNQKYERYFVIRDAPALTGKDIKDPKQEFDSGPGGGGQPIVTMDFTGSGRDKFQKVTREIAQRGSENQTPGQPAANAFQHFAVVLDNKIVSRPYIDFQQNPDGIDGRTGAQISGGFTIQSAQDLANFLKIGALPIRLELISQSQVSATLGKQALNQGLIAGLAGFILVAVFLIAVYRVLGLIAVGALLIYALYFYALIKLVPITLTLPGIAGLILTIGIAADANIVIFERIKEEIRAGRSIPAGIAAGYKKGFSTIVDANVVTIMVAFILFILATAGVKGFAFTLGVGVIVSLFTAVLATQAILGTMSRSKLISRPSALGAGERRMRFNWDFMGASKWFFSMSGVILIIGALAVGGKGLNLGIDFESGTRIKTNLEQKANVEQVRSELASIGYGDAKIQTLNDPDLGRNVVQISTPTLGPNQVKDVRAKLDQRFGVGQSFSSQSIGPTFGQTVAQQALIAIIASLLVISIYIALRFEWKFAVPVLIALMHDILITGGVYALTEREVTVSTVAALLTILGFSLYDTIIVFDRIRENVPRMPRATFSQIVNRSMSEVLARSLATSFSTSLPILCLLLFGGDTLKDFAFALLIGTISGTYSSIFIASPVLTHWKEREPVYSRRHERVAREHGGIIPAYAVAMAGVPTDVPVPEKPSRRRRLTEPEEPEQISQDEFDDLVRDLHPEVAGERDRERDPTADATPEEVVMPSSRRANGDPKPKREKQKRPRNRRHGRSR